jgi:MFS family permease
LYILAVTRAEALYAVTLLGIATLFMYNYIGPTHAVFQNMMHPRMRVTCFAIISMLYSLIGNGLGPLLVGALSDHFAADPARSAGGESLMLALAIVAVMYFWAAAHYLLATRTLREEWALPIEA